MTYASFLPPQAGGLVFGDLRCMLLPRVGLDARVTAFRTDSYDARVYATENDLPGSIGSVMLQGTGLRAHAMLTAFPGAGLRCVLRYERTLRLDALPIGSGRDAVDGRAIGAWSVQVESGVPSP